MQVARHPTRQFVRTNIYFACGKVAGQSDGLNIETTIMLIHADRKVAEKYIKREAKMCILIIFSDIIIKWRQNGARKPEYRN